MNGPSTNATINRANIYTFTAVQDLDGSLDPVASFPSTPTLGLVPCSAQCHSTEVYDEQGRASSLNQWTITVRPSDVAGLPLKRNDRFDILARDGTTVLHKIYLDGNPRDGAGRGNAMFPTAREVL